MQFTRCELVLLLVSALVESLDNGLALTPPMGFNTWNSFGCNINETIARANIDLMVDMGLVQAGYQYFNLDDCWHARERVKQGPNKGQLTWNSTKFPSGIPALAEYAHSQGLKFGMYSDAGYYTCQHYPGSYGYEEIDAKTFASWGVDYLKYDNCYAPPTPAVHRYGAMSDALNATGRPIVFSLCDWGWAEPYTWAGSIGNSWRTTGDIWIYWVYIMRNLDGTIGLSQYAGPGAWNDPDMLEVGNIDSYYPASAHKAHFVLWCILKAPLIIGSDLRTIKKEYLDMLKMKEVIAVNQDSLGIAGDLIRKQGFMEVYAAPLADGSRAVVFLNRNEAGPAYTISVAWKDLGFPKHLAAKVRDLCEEKDVGVFNGSVSFTVSIFNAVMVKISPIDGSDAYMDWRPWDSGFFGPKAPPSEQSIEINQEDLQIVQGKQPRFEIGQFNYQQESGNRKNLKIQQI